MRCQKDLRTTLFPQQQRLIFRDTSAVMSDVCSLPAQCLVSTYSRRNYLALKLKRYVHRLSVLVGAEQAEQPPAAGSNNSMNHYSEQK